MTTLKNACDTALVESAISVLKHAEFGLYADQVSTAQIELFGTTPTKQIVFVTVARDNRFSLICEEPEGETFAIHRTGRSTWVTYGRHRIELNDFPQPVVDRYIEHLVSLANQMNHKQTPTARLEDGIVVFHQ
jgi:hypothetical protein